MLSHRYAFVGLILVMLVGLPACGPLDDDPEVPPDSSDITTPTPQPTATPPVPTPTTPEVPDAAPSLTPTTSEQPPTATSTLPEAEELEPTEPLGTFSEEVDALLAEREGIYSIVVTSQYDEIAYQYDADHMMEAASLYKLPVMVEIYRQREAGILDFDETVYMDPAFFNEADGDVYDDSYIGAEVVIDDLVYNMITLSSNVAAYALLEVAGTENINATMLDLGLTSTEIRWSPIASAEPGAQMADYAWLQESDEDSPDERADEAFNVTTASDIAYLFQLLLEGSVVSPEASAEMLELLEQQQVNYLLPAEVPEGVVIAHKTGTLPGLTHDCGVIYTSSGPVVVAVMIETDYEDEAVGFLNQLGWLVYTFGEQMASP